jgi:hypothetical protein
MTPKWCDLVPAGHGLETYGCKRTLQQLANRCRPARHPQAEPEIADSFQLIRVERALQPLLRSAIADLSNLRTLITHFA